MKIHFTSIKRTTSSPGNKGREEVYPILIEALTGFNLTVEHAKVRRIFNLVERHHGKIISVKFQQEIYLAVRSYYLGQPIAQITTFWTKTDRQGFPLCISFLKRPGLKQNPKWIRAVLSLLYRFKGIKVKAAPDLTSITKPWSLTSVPEPIYKKIVEGGRSFLRRSTEENPLVADHQISCKQGPNGKRTLAAAADLLALLDSPLLNVLLQWIELTGNHVFLQSLIGLGKADLDFEASNKYKLGCLSTKLEGGGKVRVFAQIDYWTQCLLKPLHNLLDRILRGLDQDGTFDQGKCKGRVQQWSAEGRHLYSFDLKSATDRLPVTLQTKLLGEVIGEELSGLWQQLMVNRIFMYKQIPHQYAVGQPMGAYSSWPLLAITHHAIVRAAKVEDYVIVGDDVVISGHEGAQRYKELITSLGVEVSIVKSLLPPEKKGIKSPAEFCKSLYVGGHNVTPIPTRLFTKAVRIPALWAELLACTSASWDADLTNFSVDMILSLSRRLFRAKEVENIVDLVTFPAWAFHNPKLRELLKGSSPWGFEDPESDVLKKALIQLYREVAQEKVAQIDKEIGKLAQRKKIGWEATRAPGIHSQATLPLYHPLNFFEIYMKEWVEDLRGLDTAISESWRLHDSRGDLDVKDIPVWTQVDLKPPVQWENLALTTRRSRQRIITSRIARLGQKFRTNSTVRNDK